MTHRSSLGASDQALIMAQSGCFNQDVLNAMDSVNAASRPVVFALRCVRGSTRGGMHFVLKDSSV